jgi:hypothetical protein
MFEEVEARGSIWRQNEEDYMRYCEAVILGYND